MTKRSSTSSFETAPRLGRSLLWAVLVSALSLVALEVLARKAGHTASVTDDENLLCLQLANRNQERAVVLVGASRIRAGFSAEVFRRLYPSRPLVNLALAGKCPLAMLAELAADEQFRGTVVYAINETCLNRFTRNHQADRIDYCKTQWSTSKAVSRSLRLNLEPHAALLRPTLGLRNVLTSLERTGSLPEPDYYFMSRDRLNNIDFSEKGAEFGRIRVARLQAHHRRFKPTGVSQWLAEARLTDRYVRAIQRRGGKVYVVRFPTTGPFWSIDERVYPRSKYWDGYARFSEATLIHFRDLPTADLSCGDHSHLDGRDAPAFTEALLDAMALDP